MTAKITLARLYATGRIAADVHLDTTKTVVDPTLGTIPNPAWILHREWTAPATWAAMSAAAKTAWLNAIKAELVAQAQAQLALLNDQTSGGTALAIEGQTFLTP